MSEPTTDELVRRTVQTAVRLADGRARQRHADLPDDDRRDRFVAEVAIEYFLAHSRADLLELIGWTREQLVELALIELHN